MKKLFVILILTIMSADVYSVTKKINNVHSSFLIASNDGTVLNEYDSYTIRPIASISKLMLALLIVNQNLDEQISIPSKRRLQTSIPRTTHLLTRRELLTMSLIKSDNFASQILCDNLPNCIDNMNNKARELGMVNTTYKDPTGLDSGNVSTARDLLQLLMVASTNDIISSISSSPVAEIHNGRYNIKINNTNPLTSKFKVILSKTGFTNPAGGCLVMILATSVGNKIYVLLGSKNTRTRIVDMEQLVKKYVD